MPGFIGRQRLRGDNRDHIVGCGLALKVDLHILVQQFCHAERRPPGDPVQVGRAERHHIASVRQQHIEHPFLTQLPRQGGDILKYAQHIARRTRVALG